VVEAPVEVPPKEIDTPVEMTPPVRQEGSLRIKKMIIKFNPDNQLVDVFA
jgi:hypothetical protein